MKELEKIKLYLFDMDGTIYVDNKLIKGAKDAIDALLANGKQVCFLTNNSSKSRHAYINKLRDLGIEISNKQIYTSGMAMCEYLNTHYEGKSVYLVGNKHLHDEFLGYKIPLTVGMPDIVVLGYDTELTYEKLVHMTRYVKKGAMFFATHPDINCPSKDVYLPDVGSFLALVEKSTGIIPSVICGKPSRFMGETIMSRFHVKPHEVAMCGDRLSTDIQFAINNGFTGVLVLTGETTREMAEASETKADIIIENVSCLKEC